MGNANIELDQLHSDDETEKLALAAVEAIKRLITERHALRGGLAAKERELARPRALYFSSRELSKAGERASYSITALRAPRERGGSIYRICRIALASRRTAKPVRLRHLGQSSPRGDH